MLGILRQIAERDIIAHFWSRSEIKSGKHKHSNLCRNRATIKGTVWTTVHQEFTMVCSRYSSPNNSSLNSRECTITREGSRPPLPLAVSNTWYQGYYHVISGLLSRDIRELLSRVIRELLSRDIRELLSRDIRAIITWYQRAIITSYQGYYHVISGSYYHVISGSYYHVILGSYYHVILRELLSRVIWKLFPLLVF